MNRWDNIIKTEIKEYEKQTKTYNTVKRNIEEIAKELSKFVIIKILQKITNFSIKIKLKSNIIIEVIDKWIKIAGIEFDHVSDMMIEIKTYQPISNENQGKVAMSIRLDKRLAIHNQCNNSGLIFGIKG